MCYIILIVNCTLKCNLIDWSFKGGMLHTCNRSYFTSSLSLSFSPFSHLRYHHITVFIFSWYAISGLTAQVHWFGSLNYTVHALMYSYYGLRAYGYKLPSSLAKFITTLQLSQMFVGIFVNGVAFRATLLGEGCTFYWDIFYSAVAMYISYAILFMNFFYQRYIRKKPRKSKNE